MDMQLNSILMRGLLDKNLLRKRILIRITMQLLCGVCKPNVRHSGSTTEAAACGLLPQNLLQLLDSSLEGLYMLLLARLKKNG